MKSLFDTCLCLALLLSSGWCACLSSGNEQTINSALSAAGPNGVVQLCQQSVFTINNPVAFTADGQELSTQGYPSGTKRATIIISSSNTQLTGLVYGSNRNNVKILNLIIDGNRPANWLIPSGSSANIELGAAATGATVANTASRNPRGWSCMHITEGSTQYPYGCTKANITNNDIGPCGTETQWSDGISFACARSSVTNNNIVGPTDGGIVIFGAPESTISGNIITGSTTQRGFGGINLVDGTYSGNYSGVVVKNNQIIGQKMFNLGIAVGSSVWGGVSSASNYNKGPVQIIGNSFSGNIVTSIAVNGWTNGLTVSGTQTSTTKPNYQFADANVGFQDNDCTGYYATWKVFNSNAALSYWSPGILGSYTLDAAFVNSTYGTPFYYLCSKPAIASSVSFVAGNLSVTPDQGRVAVLHRGIQFQYQSDNNLVAVNYSDPNSVAPVWASGHNGYACGGATNCRLIFQGDSNLVNYVNSTAVWASGTNNGQSNKMVVLNQAPWIQIVGPTGTVLWDTTKLK